MAPSYRVASHASVASDAAVSDTSTLDDANMAHSHSLRDTSVSLPDSITPPTSVTHSAAASEHDALKETQLEPAAAPISRRSVRTRDVPTTYNDKILSGHAVHTRRDYHKADNQWHSAMRDRDTLQRVVSGKTLVEEDDSPSKQLLGESSQARVLDLINRGSPKTSPKKSPKKSPVRRKSVRAVGKVASAAGAVVESVLGKRKFEVFKQGVKVVKGTEA